MKKLTFVDFGDGYNKTISLINKELTSEWINIFEAGGRVLSGDIVCKKNLPAFNNAAMDGFAFRYKDKEKKLTIKKTIFAGDDIQACLKEEECYKIMTGAKAPDDIDTIIPFEVCEKYDENSVILGINKVKKGNALRVKGEEQKVGSLLFKKGTYIDAKVIAMLASQGIVMVEVYTPLKIAVFSTGDELQEPWEKASDNQIYNVNSSALVALLNEHGFSAEYCGVIPDNLEKSIEYFSKLKSYDAIITSGGISMGEADFVEEALIKNGLKTLFHGINIKPGKPTMIGSMDSTLVASMPGNPLAAYVNTFLFLLPALKKMQGSSLVYHQSIEAINKEELNLKAGRVNVVLGSYEDGFFNVFEKNKYGSGMLTPLVKSNALFVSSKETTGVESGEKIKILLFDKNFNLTRKEFWE